MIIVIEDDKGEVIARIPTDEGSRFEVVKKGYRVTRFRKRLPKLKWQNGKLILIKEVESVWQQGGEADGEGVAQGACVETRHETRGSYNMDEGMG